MAVFTAIGAALFGAGTFLAGATAFLLQTAVGIGMNLLAQSLAGKPQKPGFSVQGKLRAGGDVPRSFILGRGCSAGSLVYANTWGHAGGTPNAYLTQVIALSDLPVSGLAEVWVGGELCTLDGTAHPQYGFPVLEYRKNGKDHLWAKFYDGTQTNTDPFLTGTVFSPERPYSPSRVGRGIAYVIMTALVNEELFSGFPEYKFALDGVRLYDPSRDDSVGGEGDQRWSDPSTWGGDGDHLPVVQLYNLLRGITYGGEWFYGLQNVAGARLPIADWITQIEKCRALVAGPSGNEPTYRTGGEIIVGATIADAIEALLTGCQGRLAEVGGTYAVRVGAPGGAEFAFTDDEVLSTEEQSFTPFYGLSDTITGITSKYPSPEEAWNTAVAPPLYRTDLEELAGKRRLLADVSLGLVPYKGQVQRLMKSALAEAQRARRHTLTLPPEFWAYAVPGSVLSWTSKRNGYVNKLFRVDGAIDKANLDIVVDITEVDPSDYDWDQNTDYTPPVIAPVGPIRPAPQPVTGWQVLPAVIESGGRRRPSVEIRFDGGLEDVQSVRVQARFPDTLEVVFDGEVPYGDPEPGQRSIILNGTFLGGTAYDVRGRFVPYSSRPTEWSAWLPVTTPDIGITQGELDASVNAAIDMVNKKIPELFARIREAQDDLGAILNGQITRRVEADGLIWQGVGARFGESMALAERGMSAAADANGAIAAIFDRVLAQSGAGEAESLLRIVAQSSSEVGVLAAIEFAVRAGFGNQLAEAALQLAAFHDVDNDTYYSRIRARADWFDFVDSNGVVSPLNLAVISEVENTPITGGEIEVDLGTRRTMYQTPLTGDAEMQFPKGARVGSVWLHSFLGQGIPSTITFDPQSYMVGGNPPVIPDDQGIYTLAEGVIVSMTPPVADFRILQSGSTDLTSVRRFVITPAVNGRTLWDLDVHGPCTISEPGTYTITPVNEYLLCSVKIWGPGGGSGAASAGAGSTLSDPTLGQSSTFDTMIATSGLGSGTRQRNSPGITAGFGGDGGTASGGDINISGNAGERGESGSSVSRGGAGAAAPSGGGGSAAGGTNTAAGQAMSGDNGKPPGGGAGGAAVSHATGQGQYRVYTGGGGSGGVSQKEFGVGALTSTPHILVVGAPGSAGSITGGSSFLGAAGSRGAPGGAVIT